jgi:purine nucleosidase/pyrimidine-specific ribonucleoside hydrolase
MVMAADVHGGDGLGGITLLSDSFGQARYPMPQRLPHPTPAVEAIPAYARAHPEEITLVAIGPLTNLARAAERDSDGMRRYREIVVMGGAFRSPGNITPAAEFNVFVDPDAAQTVLDLGVPLRFVPLDVTGRVLVHPADLAEETWGLGHRAPRTDPPRPAPVLPPTFWQDCLQHTFGFYTELVGYPGCHLHDPLAVAAVIRPGLFRFRDAFVEVETEGEVTRGMTLADLRERRHPPAPNCAFAEDVDVEGARTFVLERLLAM